MIDYNLKYMKYWTIFQFYYLFLMYNPVFFKIMSIYLFTSS